MRRDGGEVFNNVAVWSPRVVFIPWMFIQVELVIINNSTELIAIFDELYPPVTMTKDVY